MNPMPNEALSLIKNIITSLENEACDIVLCVPFLYIWSFIKKTLNTNVVIGAQNCWFESEGAFTGEISAKMLSDIGINWVIIGHSERRFHFKETNEIINKKIFAAVENKINVVLCVGETLEEKDSFINFEVISIQTKLALSGIEEKYLPMISIAYEPVWAIGNKKAQDAFLVNEICFKIRLIIKKLYNENASNIIKILYGGSVNSSNSNLFLLQPQINGLLVGNASLKLSEFLKIIKNCKF
jgi:triosephosphate isomerase